MGLLDLYRKCELCPRECGVDRTSTLGYCKASANLRVSYIGPHFGEEPPITGSNGSGTVFFSFCSLRCTYCQNYQISHQGLGTELSHEGLVNKVLAMIHTSMAHNLNLVTFDHFTPHVILLVQDLRDKGLTLPTVANISGYQSKKTLSLLKDYVDIYLPDFKYADTGLAKALSKAEDYPKVALDAIYEMVKTRGFLDLDKDDTKPASKGCMVRHLILPGHIRNSLDALSMLFIEFGKDLPISLMSQYYPALPQPFEELNRQVYDHEFNQVLDHAIDLGFENIFVQYPEKDIGTTYLPDFTRAQPFVPSAEE